MCEKVQPVTIPDMVDTVRHQTQNLTKMWLGGEDGEGRQEGVGVRTSEYSHRKKLEYGQACCDSHSLQFLLNNLHVLKDSHVESTIA